jgi:hypothetical protein
MKYRRRSVSPGKGQLANARKPPRGKVFDGGSEKATTTRVLVAITLEEPCLVLQRVAAIREELCVGRAARQQDPLVLTGHRSHGLGVLLKTANLRQLGARAELIYTFTAEETRRMLAVNEALGFRPAGFEGARRKVLS